MLRDETNGLKVAWVGYMSASFLVDIGLSAVVIVGSSRLFSDLQFHRLPADHAFQLGELSKAFAALAIRVAF